PAITGLPIITAGSDVIKGALIGLLAESRLECPHPRCRDGRNSTETITSPCHIPGIVSVTGFGKTSKPRAARNGNNDASGYHLSRRNADGKKPHPARFPVQVPLLFVRFLTDPGDLVLDPFAGSNTTGEICEAEVRN